MLIMNSKSVSENKEKWEKIDVKLPCYDIDQLKQQTLETPTWLHFGAGNIFRGYIAALSQNLINKKLSNTGIIVAETFDYDIIEKIYKPFDNLAMLVTLNVDSSTEKEIIASVVKSLCVNEEYEDDLKSLKEITQSKALQIISLTITEKGYAIYNAGGELLPVVVQDMQAGPCKPRHTMSVICALLLERFKAGKPPVAVVSMDNCSNNGDRLKASITTIAKSWFDNGFVNDDFIRYLGDENYITFPISMIDKITPRPAQIVCDDLTKGGIKDMTPIVTNKNTYIAPFVNAESAQYLVIEDKFPNGRPPLEQAGVFIANRETVEKTERMKVTTCLNPLHTAMSVYGCILGHTLISEMMKDNDIVKLIGTLGYKEGLPVVVDPGIISPKEFIDEVITQRLPNPFVPDTPQRIATDTSQKVGIRFGETIKSYVENGKDVTQLVAVPLAIAGWLRYLLAVNDDGESIELSPDPMFKEINNTLSGIKTGDVDSYNGQLLQLLKNKSIFGVDYEEVGLSGKIEDYFKQMLCGTGSVRRTLQKALNN